MKVRVSAYVRLTVIEKEAAGMGNTVSYEDES